MEPTMFFLPKGTPQLENIDATKLVLPDILDTSGSDGFSGYISFVFPSSTVFLVFETGHLTLAHLEELSGARMTSLEALLSLAKMMLSSDSGVMNIYTLSKELSACIRELFRSETLYQARELKTLNMRSLLEKIKAERISGCLRAYSGDRSALIFYKNGAPLGFFHDGSFELETSASESQRIASLPDARIDLFSKREEGLAPEADLLELINIQKLWKYAMAGHQA